MSQLHVQNLDCLHQQQPILRNLTFTLDSGEIGCLLGASGCGKTTALRTLAGFHPNARGQIRLGDQWLLRDNLALPAHQRRVGLVFQDHALFPHLSVQDNIGFGLHRSLRPARVRQLLEMTGLGALAKAYPHQLSGGQQQRVALARAMAPHPALLLLDEPFSNLDVELREQLGREIRQWLKSEKITAVLVTHDQHEAFAMADQVGVLHQGQLQQWANPYQLYHQPQNRYVADFIGEGVWLPARISGPNRIACELGDMQIPLSQQLPPGQPVDLLLRPDDILHQDSSPLQARVIHKVFRGAEFLYRLQLPSGDSVLSLVPSHHNHALGEAIGIQLDIRHGIIFERAG